MCERMLGTVEWFDFARGFGFIMGDDGPDYFVHLSNLRDRYRPLLEGVSVEFTPSMGQKGLVALDVVAL